MFEDIETIVEHRNNSTSKFSLLDEMIVSRGDKDDWQLLHDLHYRNESGLFAPKFWKTSLYGETIGCIVTTPVKGLLKERHVVFPKLKNGKDTKLVNSYRYSYINANFRLVSRHVVDTMYRGIGVGYRMMNLVARMEGSTYMEIQSAMSKYNFFGQQAGFRYVKPMRSNKFDLGIAFFRETFEANPQDFESIIAEIESKSPEERTRLLAETQKFYYRHSALERTGDSRNNLTTLTNKGLDRVNAMSPRELIKNMQQMIMASPLYGIYFNPDHGRALPETLPLTAFDRQPANKPLVF